MSALTRTLTLAFAVLGIGLFGGCSSGIEVEVLDSAALGQHDLIFVSIDDPWIGTHSVVGLLQQELQRRGYAVRRGTPTEELKERSMILKLDHAGSRETPGEGRIDELRHLDFRLLEGSTGRLLATASYHEEDLDEIEQKLMLRDLADQLFGAR